MSYSKELLSHKATLFLKVNGTDTLIYNINEGVGISENNSSSVRVCPCGYLLTLVCLSHSSDFNKTEGQGLISAVHCTQSG